MGAIKFTDIDENYGATLDKSLYYLRINKQFETEQEAVKAMNSLAKRMNNARKAYSDVSFYIGASNTQGNDAVRTYERTGKRGRPKKTIEGNAVPHHLHVVVYGDGASAFCNKVRDKLNKKHGARYAYSECRTDRNAYAIRYVVNQAYATRQGGDFDFEDYSYKFKWERPL